jgi:hypothetical protein
MKCHITKDSPLYDGEDHRRLLSIVDGAKLGAAEQGHDHLLRSLIQKYQNTPADEWPYEMIALAAANGHLNIIKLMVELGATPKPKREDYYIDKPAPFIYRVAPIDGAVVRAARCRRTEILHILLPLREQSRGGWLRHAIHGAIRHGHREAAQVIIDALETESIIWPRDMAIREAAR